MTDLALDIAGSAAGIAIFLAFSWAVARHFGSETMPIGMKLVSAAAIGSAIIMLVLTWVLVQPMPAQWLGIATQIAAAALFAWAIAASRAARLKLAFDPALPHTILGTGPYGLIRHPLYASYVLFWAGWAVATWSPIAIFPFAVMAGLYLAAARREEGLFRASPLRDDYEAYRQKAGLFLPRWSALTGKQ